MKKIVKKVMLGVGMGCFGFVAMLFIASAFAGGANVFIGQKTGEEWLQTAACFIFIAVGFYVPSLVYEKENLATGLKVLIHMTAGVIVFLLTSYFAGWIEGSFGAVAVYILTAVGTAAVVWVIYVAVFKIQADRMNRKIREKQPE